jgi:hypothetical protein
VQVNSSFRGNTHDARFGSGGRNHFIPKFNNRVEPKSHGSRPQAYDAMFQKVRNEFYKRFTNFSKTQNVSYGEGMDRRTFRSLVRDVTRQRLREMRAQ